MHRLATCLLAWLLLAPAAAADSWQRPVHGSLLRAFSLSADRFAAGQHRGVDLAAPIGTEVRAACGGRVSFAGSVPRGGRTVSVRCGRLTATYQQLGSVAVGSGTVVLAGSALGTVGRSRDPRTPAAHVHLGARVTATGRYLDPLSLIGPTAAPQPPVVVVRARPVRPVGLGPAPVGRPQPVRAPAPLAHAALRRAPPARPLPAGMQAGLDGATARPARNGGLPWTVWVGLLCAGLGLPLGGLVAGRRRRRATRPLTRAAT